MHCFLHKNNIFFHLRYFSPMHVKFQLDQIAELLLARDGCHGINMAIDELHWSLSTGDPCSSQVEASLSVRFSFELVSVMNKTSYSVWDIFAIPTHSKMFFKVPTARNLKKNVPHFCFKIIQKITKYENVFFLEFWKVEAVFTRFGC